MSQPHMAAPCDISSFPIITADNLAYKPMDVKGNPSTSKPFRGLPWFGSRAVNLERNGMFTGLLFREPHR